jgi:hypothetical protein
MTNRIAGWSGNEPIVLGVISESALSPARFGQIASMSGRSRRWNIRDTTSKSLSSSPAAIMEIIICKAATFEIPFHRRGQARTASLSGDSGENNHPAEMPSWITFFPICGLQAWQHCLFQQCACPENYFAQVK